MLADAMELGVKHTTINIPYHHIIGGNLAYEYNGTVYHFNEDLIASYDRMISAFSGKGIIVYGDPVKRMERRVPGAS